MAPPRNRQGLAMSQVYSTVLEVHTNAPNSGYELKPIPKKYETFSRTRPINMLYDDPTIKPDLVDLMGQLDKGSTALFVQIKQNTNPRTGVAYLDPKDMSRGQLNNRSKYFKELRALDMVRRVPVTGLQSCTGLDLAFRKHTFMIHPQLIYPISTFEDEIRHLWSQLK
jgi:hypothetical protein